jgi:hypothetical protein
MARRIDIFYAYPSSPESMGETITNAIHELRGDRVVKDLSMRFRPWPDMLTSGKRIVTEITKTIDFCEIFACDLTYPNLNVAFELGFAIGRFKRLWISLNTSIEGAAQRYKRTLEGIVGAGYHGYENHHEISAGFLNDAPWRSLEDHLLGESYRRPAPRPELPTLLYVKPPVNTDAVIATLEHMQASEFHESLIVDDPRENSAQTLEWYAEKISLADAVIVHLLAADHRESQLHNVKASFVAGLAHGLRKNLLMLAHTPFDPPTDYRLLLKSHGTAEECSRYVAAWLLDLGIARRRPRRPEEGTRRKASTLELRYLSIGEPVAEHENLQLDEYFVETTAYFHALEAQATIMIGRRGTGKTANLIALQAAFGRDRRNHVCTVKPVGYEVEGLVRLLKEDLHEAERGYLIDSLWKFLIYSELAASVCRELEARPTHQAPSASEDKLTKYVNANAAILLTPFSQRLDRAVRSLAGVGDLKAREEQRTRISENLHSALLGDLRRLLGEVLSDRNKVAILIDNLDEPWGPGHETSGLADLLLGLLRVSRDVCDDLQHEDYWQKGIHVCLTIFLRSDIFAYIQPLASEQDKWPLYRVTWNDRAVLLRVLDERLKHRAPTRYDAEDIWEGVFAHEVVGLPTRDFVLSNTMARPRDVIYLLREAIAKAINRGHAIVTAEDFLDAREEYSRYVFTSILGEDDPGKQKLEAVLYEFAGAPKTVTAREVASRIAKAGVSEADVDFYINLLCDVNFLAVQTASGFKFPSDEQERSMLRSVARKLPAERGWGEEAYEINAAFYQALQIE